jgi:isopenicillin N synthase-like dioxygenase
MADKVVEQVQAACSGSGFFIITGHGIQETHFTSVFNEAAVRLLAFSCAC